MKKPMIIQDVSDFVQIFSKIVKHFKVTSKSTSLCNDVVDILFEKAFMAFWLTGAAYLLHFCLKAVELLVPICDVLISVGLKKEETDSFLAP